MARVKNPLLSLDASGRIAGSLTFGRVKAGSIAKAMLKPASGRIVSFTSAAQAAQRAAYSAAVTAWHALTAPQKAAWRETAKPLHLTGFNAFISDYLLSPPPPAGTVWDSGSTTWDGGSTIWD